MKIATLCYLIDKDKKKILLGKKKYGGAKGKLNGFGGKFEQTDSSIKKSLQREFTEETGVNLKAPKLHAVLFFHFSENKKDITVYVYKCFSWTGTLKESEEMSVHWYEENSIPVDKMWPSDSIWFPLVMKYSNLIIDLHFKKDHELPDEISIKFNQKLKNQLPSGLA